MKLFFGIFLPSFIVSIVLSAIFFQKSTTQIRDQYQARYVALLEATSDTIQQVEKTSNQLMEVATQALLERIRNKGLPSEKELRKLAAQYHVTHLYIADHKGNFIRSTNEHTGQLPNLFRLCPRYVSLLTDGVESASTGIIPGIPSLVPYKFFLRPTYGKRYLVEAGIRVDTVGNFLKHTLDSDPHIQEISLYAPNGASLGNFSRKGVEYESRLTESPGHIKKSKFLESEIHVVKEVPTLSGDFASCERSALADAGRYFYRLKIHANAGILKSKISAVAKGIVLLFFGSLLFSFFVARFLSQKLVKPVLELEKQKAAASVAEQIVHDLRSPLSALTLTLRNLNELPAHSRHIVESSVQKIHEIIQMLKMGRGIPGVRKEVLLPLIQSVVEEKNIRFEEQGVSIQCGWEKDCQNAKAQVNALEFKRVISNLLENSCEAVQANWAAKPQVRCRILSDSHNWIVSVEDNGVGIQPNQTPFVFNRGTSYGKNEGMGLGLFYAREKIEEWNGRIEFESTVGKGTTFFVYVPRGS